MTSPDRMPWHSVFLRGSVTARFDFFTTPERRGQVGPASVLPRRLYAQVLSAIHLGGSP